MKGQAALDRAPAHERGRRCLTGIVAITAITLGVVSLPVAVGFGGAQLAINVGYVVVGGAFLATGWLIMTRRPGNGVGPALLILGLLYEYFAVADAYVRLPGPPPGAAFLGLGVWLGDAPFFACFSFLLLVFPTGRLLTPRWRVVIGLNVLLIVLFLVGRGFDATPFDYYPWLSSPLGVPGFPGRQIAEAGYPLGLMSFLAATSSLVVRWRRAGGQERAQLKWVAAAASAFGAVFAPYVITYDRDFDPTRSDLTSTVMISVAQLLLPLAVGIAVLRYRLYDIDRLISRTLAYAALTAILAGAYVVGFLGVQAVIAPFTASGGPIAVAASTLGVFALFQPLRRRLKESMDRRFNRSRYDAQRTVESFAIRLRNEVDIDRLDHEIAAVVRSTLAPVHASVWLRPSARNEYRTTEA